MSGSVVNVQNLYKMTFKLNLNYMECWLMLFCVTIYDT